VDDMGILLPRTGGPAVTGIWQDSLRAIEGKIKPHNFDMWIKPIECVGLEGDRLRLRAPNRFIKEWFEDNYLPSILEVAEGLAGQSLTVLFDVREETPVEVALAAAHAEAARQKSAGAVPDVVLDPPSDKSEGRYTFDSFVVGPSNQLAYAASRAVSEVPAGKYNPLFIYGGVGLGKTHLLRAIGSELQRRNPSWKLQYLKAESYMNEYITAVRGSGIEAFRAKYRDHCDVLLMDDIQFIAGKDRTMEEFFHTFNSLYESHKQMVFTADRYPHEIPDLEERIRSRFQWGLIADIQPPELETRIAIIEKKAAADNIDLPKDVSLYLATNIKSNVRELEGLLIRVAAAAALLQTPISVEFAKDTLKSFVSQAQHSLTVEAIQKEVALYFNLKPADLKSARRQQLVARPRQIAMYLSRKLVKASYPELGQRFGGKDHTTVMSACRKIEDLVVSDPKTRHVVEQLERNLTQ